MQLYSMAEMMAQIHNALTCPTNPFSHYRYVIHALYVFILRYMHLKNRDSCLFLICVIDKQSIIQTWV